MAEAADFFVSYTSTDRPWAEWIAWQLEEEEGYSVDVQAWDFTPGRSWTHKMQQATARAERVVAVLSAAYLESEHSEAEWQVFQAKDPLGKRGLLLPVRVGEVDPPGLLKTRIYVDLVGRDAASARALLVAAARGARGKPANEPEFPGERGPTIARSSEAPRFPRERSLRDDSQTPARTGQPKTAHLRVINPAPVVPPSWFQNRDKEISRLGELLWDDAVRMITVQGPDDVGKTALVCRLLESLRADRIQDDGSSSPATAIVYLSEAGSQQLKAETLFGGLCQLLPEQTAEWMREIWQDEPPTIREKFRALLAEFQSGRTIVVLDNFDELINRETVEIYDRNL